MPQLKRCGKQPSGSCVVMAGLVPAIHAFTVQARSKTWMPGTIGERSDAVLWTAMAGHDGGTGVPEYAMKVEKASPSRCATA